MIRLDKFAAKVQKSFLNMQIFVFEKIKSMSFFVFLKIFFEIAKTLHYVIDFELFSYRMEM